MSLYLICEELEFEVYLSDGVLHFINQYRQKYGTLIPESCGIIIGEIRSKSLRVLNISPPAIDDIRTRNTFLRKSGRHQRYLNNWHTKSNGVLRYIGEWHTHPEPNPRPSSSDFQGWSELMTNNDFNVHPKLLWIASNSSYINDWFNLVVNKKYYNLNVIGEVSP